MHHAVPLITTIAAAFGCALILGFLAAKVRLPALVGYLLAGIIIGPYSPGFTANSEIAAQLAEIGVMLLMFGVGLHFSLDHLWEVRKVALPGALLQIIVATALGASLALIWGWGIGAALVFGLSLSVASTVVLLKALETRGQLETTNGRIAVGWLIVEDLAMVLVLVLLPPLSSVLGGKAAPALGPDLYWTIGVTIAKIAAFVIVMLALGRRVFPWLLWQVARTGSRELFVLCVVAASVSLAYAAAELFGVSFALGAFFAGVVISEIRIQPSRGRRVPAAARRLRGAVLCFRRHAVRSVGGRQRALARSRRGGDHYHRQVACSRCLGVALPLPAEYRADSLRESRANWRILFHSGRIGHEPRPIAA